MRLAFYHSFTALSTGPTISGSASVPNYFAGQRPQAANTYGSGPSFPITALRWLLTASFSLLICFSTLAQNNYNAGYNSGTGGSGSANVFVGPYAGLSNTTGERNSFVGYAAGTSNTTGWRNSFLGCAAGNRNTTGSDNSFLGHWAGLYNTTGNSNSFLGNYAGYSNKTGGYNSFLGIKAGYFNTSGYNNSSLGYQAGYFNTTGFNNLFLGSNTNPSLGNLVNAGAIGSNAYVSASNSLVLGSIYGVNGATATTNVGIGTSAPAYLLHVNGTAAKPGGGSWKVASDQRLKKNISTFSEGLTVLTKIKPVWFEYNGEAGMPTEQKYVGVIAQEMQKIAPYTVGEFTYQDSTGKQEKYLDYDANALTYILVNSVKEQQGQIKELEQVVQQKDAQIAELTSRLAQIEAAVSKLNGEPLKATGTAQLYQNAPNPTEGTTIIGYFLPQEATSAQLKIYSVTGVEVQSIDLKGRGKGQISLSVGQLAAGQYIYHLLVDGQSIASKHLLLNR